MHNFVKSTYCPVANHILLSTTNNFSTSKTNMTILTQTRAVHLECPAEHPKLSLPRLGVFHFFVVCPSMTPIRLGQKRKLFNHSSTSGPPVAACTIGSVVSVHKSPFPIVRCLIIVVGGVLGFSSALLGSTKENEPNRHSLTGQAGDHFPGFWLLGPSVYQTTVRLQSVTDRKFTSMCNCPCP